MRNILRRLFPLEIYPDPIRRLRASGTYATGSILIIAAVLSVIVTLLQPGFSDPQNLTFNLSVIASSVALALCAVLAMILTRGGRQIAGGTIILAVWIGIIYLFAVALQQASLSLVLMIVGAALAALLVGSRALIVAIAFSIVALAISTFAFLNGATPDVQYFVVNSLIIILGAAAIYVVADGLPRTVRQVAAQDEQRRLNLALASNAIAQQLLAMHLDMGAMLTETVKLVQDAFSRVEEVHFYLSDRDRRQATLMAGTPASGELTIGQQVSIGSLNVIGRVAISGQTILVNETSEERTYRRTALLPGMRAELVVPLSVGEQIIGVMDVQSSSPNAFGPEDINELETLANQIAIAIDNARLYQESQAQVGENRRLFEQARANLREVERLNQQLTGSAWSDYLRLQSAVPAYTIDLGTGQVENVAEWTATLAEANRRNQLVIQRLAGAQTQIIALPISVRGQPIGAMEFEVAGDQDLLPEQITILQQVLERLGLALENARLFEEAQRIAQREALVNEISTRMQSTTNVEAVVAAATQSLADAFRSPRVAIRLGNPDNRKNRDD
ncbi:MAG TPA: GAF domain-containing protein [Aggregatilineales bacterium]|nr:GAF domain-containing protein [Aggregatilineales bacterium]